MYDGNIGNGNQAKYSLPNIESLLDKMQSISNNHIAVSPLILKLKNINGRIEGFTTKSQFIDNNTESYKDLKELVNDYVVTLNEIKKNEPKFPNREVQKLMDDIIEQMNQKLIGIESKVPGLVEEPTYKNMP